ncbi:LysR family transcriptional regulator [Clostridium sp. NSJ-49]|uniref:LysR family transcriptional regulator n=1 Tax=Clostridium TaxID=1485 RepID=UPI00164ACCB8|nr:MULTISPECIES: LysR family transcriptional regulator [unclassified Clostridium]MBC5624441.1 LysR family transcriptional regulator [Clostridium sp. NSJ-49]MCD2501882.1 LysR family transcriptional regulator [Clostridium sp. NSJ-145]
MNIRHLKIFITVADCGKMSEAAERLFISQPSVSQAIREIEDYYGVKLFERLSKKLYITESGELLLRYARHIVSSFDEMEADLKNSGQNICLKIGSTVTVGTCILNDIISKFEEENKDISTKIIVNNTNVIESMLLHSNLDIGIVEGIVNNKDLVRIPICSDKLVLVSGKKHNFYYKDEINIEELSGQDMIFREKGSGAREIFDSILEENNIAVNEKWNSTNTEAIKNAVIGGQGLGILSTLIIQDEIKDGTLHIIPIKNIDISREICVVYHKDKFISNHLKRLIESIQYLK